MKFALIILILAVLTGCLQHPPMKTGFEGKKLPQFTFLLPDGKSKLNTDSIKSGKSFVVFYFNPNCPYCRAEIRDMLKHNKQFQKTEYYFLTNYTTGQVKPMIEEFKLDKYKNITVAIDQNSDFIKYYFIPNVPYLAIYDSQKRLQQVFVGRTGFETINKILVPKT
jgi:peroxiredoxin